MPDYTRFGEKGWSMSRKQLVERIVALEALIRDGIAHDGEYEPLSDELLNEHITLCVEHNKKTA